MSLNQWVGIGNLGADPILRQSKSGVSVCNFTVACDGRPNSQGESRTDWVPVTVWGPRGEACAKFLQKGSQVSVVGQLRQRRYEDEDGKTRTAYEIRADEVHWLKNIRSNEEVQQSQQVVTAAPSV